MNWTGAAPAAPVSFSSRLAMLMLKSTRLFADERGASASEYALLLAIIGSAIALAAIGLGGAISNSVNKAANEINN